MSAKYDFKVTPKAPHQEGEQVLHPRIVSQGTISTDSLIEEIAHATTFTPADLKGVLTALEDILAHHLSNGYHVELGNIGYFSAKLKARVVTDKNEIRSQSVHFDNVNFRTSAWLRKHLQGNLQRSVQGLNSSKESSKDSRLIKLDAYLAEHKFITRSDYTRLTGLLKNKALAELKEWSSQGILIKQGSHNQLLFCKR